MEDSTDYGDRDRTSINFQDHLSTSTFDLDSLLSSGDNDQSIQALTFDIDWDHHSQSGNISDLSMPLVPDSTDLGRENTMPPAEPQERQHTTIVRSKECNRQFKGPSSWMNIAASFRGLHDFLQSTIQDHHVLGASKWNAPTIITEQHHFVGSQDMAESNLKRLLPDKPRCVHLSKLYFDNLGGTHGFIHAPSFWQHSRSFWDGTHDNAAWFNTLLLVLISCSRCLFPDDPFSFNANGSSGRNEILEWVRGVEAWLQYQKERQTTLEGFQVRCLVLFSKMLNDVDSNHHYRASQILLADAVAKGLHRDCRALGASESIFERESRRKTWSAIAELDIACCIEQGVPSMASDLYSDIGPPNNFNDDDYNGSTLAQPSKRPDVELTDSSFARLSSFIRPLRYNIIKLVNDPLKHQSHNSSQRNALRQQISKALSEIPTWSDSAHRATNRNQALLYRITLEVNLHELQLLLHVPFILAQSTNSPVDMDFERFVCTRSASTIIKTHELAAQHGLSHIALPKSHLLRAGLCICLLEMEAGKGKKEDHWVSLTLDGLLTGSRFYCFPCYPGPDEVSRICYQHGGETSSHS